MAHLLLANGADVNAQDKNGQTPLYRAAALWDGTSMVRLLLEHGANVNAQDNEKKLPIDYASDYVSPHDLGSSIRHLLLDAAKKAEQKAASSSNLPVSSNRNLIHRKLNSNPRSSDVSKSQQEEQDPPEKKFSPPGSPK